MSNRFFSFSDYCHMHRYPWQPSLKTNRTSVMSMCVRRPDCACHFLQLIPLSFSIPTRLVALLPCKQCQVESLKGQRSAAARWRWLCWKTKDQAEKIDRKRDKGELCGGAEQGRAELFSGQARKLEKRERDIQRNRSTGFVLSQPTCSSLARCSVSEWSDSVLCFRTPIKWYMQMEQT